MERQTLVQTKSARRRWRRLQRLEERKFRQTSCSEVSRLRALPLRDAAAPPRNVHEAFIDQRLYAAFARPVPDRKCLSRHRDCDRCSRLARRLLRSDRCRESEPLRSGSGRFRSDRRGLRVATAGRRPRSPPASRRIDVAHERGHSGNPLLADPLMSDEQPRTFVDARGHPVRLDFLLVR